MRNVLVIALAGLTGTVICSCGILMGSKDLGNKLTLLEGDHLEDRIIVYCTQYSAGACMAGMPVIPSRADSITSYVEKAKSNRRWVIAKSLRMNGKMEDYWIIDKEFNIEGLDCDKTNCDSIIQSRVTGPLTQDVFNKKRSELGVGLDF